MTEGTIQKREYVETPGEIIVPKVFKYRAWVAKNAYAVGTLAFFFIVTWFLMLVLGVVYGTPHSG